MIKTTAFVLLVYLFMGCAANVDARQDSIDSSQATTDADNTLPLAYTNCSPNGGPCGSATVCSPSMFVRLGFPAGNLCTVACTSGNAAMCPGYVPSGGIQAVECVTPAGNPANPQCMRLCNPANGNRDCAPFFTTCAAVSISAGRIYVCVP
jgi:hypothetical protein